MKEDRRRIARARDVDRDSHRIEDVIRRQEVTVNLALPVLAKLRAMQSQQKKFNGRAHAPPLSGSGREPHLSISVAS